MGRPRRTTEQEWFDVFSDADVADQVVMLRMIEELHRQKRAGPEYSRRGRWLAGSRTLPRLG